MTTPEGESRVTQKLAGRLGLMFICGTGLAMMGFERWQDYVGAFVALMSGYTHVQSTGFVKALSGLSAQGFVDYPNAGEVRLTAAGRGVAQAPDAPRSAAEVQDRVVSMLGGKTGEILRPIIEAYPEAIKRTEAASAANYTHVQSTGFVRALSRLSSLGFVTYPSTGHVKAAPVLFLEER